MKPILQFIKPASDFTERDLADLIQQQQRPLLSLALRLVGNLEEAKDLLQTAFVKLWRQRHRLLSEQPVHFYLRRILMNLCIDHLRRASKQQPVQRFEEQWFTASALDPEQQMEAAELQSQLQLCLKELPVKQKAVLLLRDIEGHTVAETAALLSCSQNSVLVNLHLARKKIKEKMQQWLQATESS